MGARHRTLARFVAMAERRRPKRHGAPLRAGSLGSLSVEWRLASRGRGLGSRGEVWRGARP